MVAVGFGKQRFRHALPKTEAIQPFERVMRVQQVRQQQPLFPRTALFRCNSSDNACGEPRRIRPS
jgi:hypothetical protein